MKRIVIALVVLTALAPVIGMVLVFAVLPALPIVLAIGAMLGPSTLLGYAQQEEDEREAQREAEAPRGARLAHAH